MPKIFAGLSLARLPRGARGDGAMSETRYGAPSETPFLGGLQNTPVFVTNEDAIGKITAFFKATIYTVTCTVLKMKKYILLKVEKVLFSLVE